MSIKHLISLSILFLSSCNTKELGMKLPTSSISDLKDAKCQVDSLKRKLSIDNSQQELEGVKNSPIAVELRKNLSLPCITKEFSIILVD